MVNIEKQNKTSALNQTDTWSQTYVSPSGMLPIMLNCLVQWTLIRLVCHLAFVPERVQMVGLTHESWENAYTVIQEVCLYSPSSDVAGRK